MTDPKYMRPGLDFAHGKAIEELGELQAALGKSLRWGWISSNPELPIGERITNAAWVRDEMRDVRDALDNLERELDIDRIALADANWKDAEEFCKGAFGLFVSDVTQYVAIVAELMQHATNRALAQSPPATEGTRAEYGERVREAEEMPEHHYSPSMIYMGDCTVCGHVQDSVLHIGTDKYKAAHSATAPQGQDYDPTDSMLWHNPAPVPAGVREALERITKLDPETWIGDAQRIAREALASLPASARMEITEDLVMAAIRESKLVDILTLPKWKDNRFDIDRPTYRAMAFAKAITSALSSHHRPSTENKGDRQP